MYTVQICHSKGCMSVLKAIQVKKEGTFTRRMYASTTTIAIMRRKVKVVKVVTLMGLVRRAGPPGGGGEL